jgi:rhodanese-related sulfurtransferase
MFRFLPLIGLLALAAPTASAEDRPAGGTTVTDVDPAAAAKLLAARKQGEELVILDIRTPEEFKTGRIDGSTNLDFYASDFQERLAKLDRDKTYLVYCASGGRSGESLGVLRELGFKTIFHLEDGIRGWRKAGMPVAKRPRGG